MKGTITPADGDASGVEFDDRAEVYRLDDGSHRVVAAAGGDQVPLGPADVTVSRKKGGEAPVELVARSDHVEVRNNQNRNAVEVVSTGTGRRREIPAGASASVERDAVIEVGHHSRLSLAVEREETPSPTGGATASEGRGGARSDGAATAIDLGTQETLLEGIGDGTVPGIVGAETLPRWVVSADTVLDGVTGEGGTDAGPGRRGPRDVAARVAELDDETAAAVGARAIAEAEAAAADCLPDGPAAAALAEARTHYRDGDHGRAVERATHVRDLAESEVIQLEAVLDPEGDGRPDMAALRSRTTRYDLDTDVATAYEDLSATVREAGGSLEGTDPPDAIPTVPEMSVGYDDVERHGRLGSGGSADVYEATVESGGREVTVAFKEPRLEDGADRDIAEEFEREADTWARLDDHENIVGVVDWGSRPHPWIAMEHMDGGPLTTVAGSLSPRRGIWTLLGIVGGVYHAHQHGVAHLDLKPGNVLLRRTGPDTWPAPKVADWGLAKMLLQHSRSIKGYTPLYAAPEQVDPDQYGSVDNQTDIYQLGAVGYALLTGEPPFEGESSTVIYKILESRVTPPSEVAPGLPERLDDIVLKAMAKDRDDRYENIVYLRDDLQEVYEALTDD